MENAFFALLWRVWTFCHQYMFPTSKKTNGILWVKPQDFNQVNCILISRRWNNSILDSRTYRTLKYLWIRLFMARGKIGINNVSQCHSTISNKKTYRRLEGLETKCILDRVIEIHWCKFQWHPCRWILLLTKGMFLKFGQIHTRLNATQKYAQLLNCPKWLLKH